MTFVCHTITVGSLFSDSSQSRDQATIVEQHIIEQHIVKQQSSGITSVEQQPLFNNDDSLTLRSSVDPPRSSTSTLRSALTNLLNPPLVVLIQILCEQSSQVALVK